MGLSISSAVKDVWRNKNSIWDILGFTLFATLPSFFISFFQINSNNQLSGAMITWAIFSIVATIVACGYAATYLHDLIKNPNAPLPIWNDLKTFFIRGFCLIFSYITVFLLLTIFNIILINIFNVVYIKILIVLISLPLYMLSTGVIINYCKNYNISEAINPINAFKFFRPKLITLIFKMFILGLLTGLACAAVTITIIGVVFTPVIMAIELLALYNLIGQYYHALQEDAIITD